MLSRSEFKEWLNRVINEKNLLDEYLYSHQNNNIKTYLYGAGHACEYYIEYFRSHSVVVTAIIDSDVNKQGRFLRDIPIISLKELIGTEGGFDIVISAPSIYREVRKQLELEICADHIYAFDVEQYAYYHNSTDKVKTYLKSNSSKLYDTYLLWNDEKSRDIMQKVICARVTSDLEYIHDIWEQNQYWPEDIITFSDNEVIVESGSCDGKTLKELLDKIERKYNKIYCFEPDEQCGSILTEIINLERDKSKIVYIPKGTYSEDTILRFSSESIESGLSYVNPEGCLEVPVTTIDNSISEPVTYIKMDIEGSELETLKGANNTILKYKPKLAVCLYHKNEDMTEIPTYLKRIRPDYRFYLRHHNCNVTETVLYAL